MLKIWLAFFHAGIELLAVPRCEFVEQLMADMTQLYQSIGRETLSTGPRRRRKHPGQRRAGMQELAELSGVRFGK